MTGGEAGGRGAGQHRPVGVEPWATCLLRALPLLAPWLLVVVVGRRICLVAQRLPPVVRLVRTIRSRRRAG